MKKPINGGAKPATKKKLDPHLKVTKYKSYNTPNKSARTPIVTKSKSEGLEESKVNKRVVRKGFQRPETAAKSRIPLYAPKSKVESRLKAEARPKVEARPKIGATKAKKETELKTQKQDEAKDNEDSKVQN